MPNPVVFFDVEAVPTTQNIVGKTQKMGRIEITLRADVVPDTADRFIAFCEGRPNGKGPSYKGTNFHRVVKGFMLQGGDLSATEGGKDLQYFPDENFLLNHTGPGTISLVNSGANTNLSQFFIALAKSSWLDGKHVVFGQVTKGMDTIKKLEDKCGAPDQGVHDMYTAKITDCGVLPSPAY